MKKVLAVFLAVLMTFCVLSVGAAADDEGGTTGNVIQYTSSGIPRINGSTAGEVVILQAGDIVRFEAVTADTSSKAKRLEIRYYPDAASIRAADIKNADWKENKVQRYNLDTAKWQLEKGQTVDDLMAKSPKYYKSFYSYDEFQKTNVPEIVVTGLNAGSVFTRDSAGVDRGEAPIDFALEGATFVGWALYKYTWAPKTTADAVVEVYALWDRDAAPVEPEKPVEPVDPTEPVKYDTPVQEAYAKFMAKYEEITEWIKALPVAIGTVLPNWLNGVIRDWLYNLFKITA